MNLLLALAQTTTSTSFGWKPFLTTMPLWNFWYLLALPLCLGVAVVYKTTKCHDASEVPRESLQLFLWIVLGLIGAATVVQLVILLN